MAEFVRESRDQSRLVPRQFRVVGDDPIAPGQSLPDLEGAAGRAALVLHEIVVAEIERQVAVARAQLAGPIRHAAMTAHRLENLAHALPATGAGELEEVTRRQDQWTLDHRPELI